MGLIFLPFPIAIITGIIMYNMVTENNYSLFYTFLAFVSIFIGTSAISHAVYDHYKNRTRGITRILAGALLLIVPVTLYFPNLQAVSVAIFILGGILLGVYGYRSFLNGNDHDIVYLYSSMFFMIIAAVLSIAIAEIYTTAIRDVYVYYHGNQWVTCHLPAFPVANDGVLYTSVMGMVLWAYCTEPAR
jgi:hypothetical protein